MDTLGFFKYHSLQCDGHTADVIFQGTAIGINYKMAKRNIPVNRFFWPCLGKFRILPMCFFIVSTSRLISSSCNRSSQKTRTKRNPTFTCHLLLLPWFHIFPSPLIASSLLTTVKLFILPGDKSFFLKKLQINSEKLMHKFWGQLLA